MNELHTDHHEIDSSKPESNNHVICTASEGDKRRLSPGHSELARTSSDREASEVKDSSAHPKLDHRAVVGEGNNSNISDANQHFDHNLQAKPSRLVAAEERGQVSLEQESETRKNSPTELSAVDTTNDSTRRLMNAKEDTGLASDHRSEAQTANAKSAVEEKQPNSECYDPTLSKRQRAILDDMQQKGELELPEYSSSIPREGILHQPTEITGRFEGEVGNSTFIPSSLGAIEQLKNYGQTGVEYKQGYPDFQPFCTHDSPWGTVNTEVDIPHMTDQRQNPSWEYGRRPANTSHDPRFDLGNFSQADNELRDKINQQNPSAHVSSEDIEKWRKDNNLVWHELPDGKTMQLVPQEIHDACRHSGGVSKQKQIMEYGNYEPDM